MTTTTIREQILAAFYTAVSGLTITDLHPYRNRSESVTEFPAIVQMDGGHVKDISNIAEDRYTVRLDLHLYTQAATDTAMTAGIESLYGPVAQMIGGFNTASPLMGLAEDVREIGTLDPEEADSDAALVVQVEIDFVTAHNNPYAQP